MHEFNRKFLLSLSHSIRGQPNVFTEGGRLLDKMFSFEALNNLRERRIRATRDEYERKLKQFEATGKLDHDEELMLANQKRLSATTRSLEDLRTARLESDLRNADQHVQMVEDTNRLISAPMIRLARAITWACGDDAFYGLPTDPEDMQAVCLVVWLAFDRAAERVEPKLTRFQTLPWFTTEDIDGHPMQGRFILEEHVAREHSTLVKVGEEAFDLVKLSLVGLGSPPEPGAARKNIAIPPKAPRRHRDDEEPSLELDRVNHLVVLNGSTIPLTPAQFQVLAKLVDARGGWKATKEIRPSVQPNATRKLIGKLPEPIHKYIEAQSGQNGGFRWAGPLVGATKQPPPGGERDRGGLGAV